jgi:succinoglycan biosynthesis protein ExoA
MIEQPFISVVMPVYNEESFIERSLSTVQAQDYPVGRMEILVVDGRSTDRTRALVRAIAADDRRITLLDNPARDQASALNVGIQHAAGEIIVRVDGHCELPPHYVSTCVRTMQRTGADNVGGQMRAIGTTPLTKAIAAATNSPFATGGSRFHYSDKPGETDTVYLGAFRRSVFDRVGLFDPSAVPNEDYELNHRILKNGGGIYYNPQIWARYYVRPSISLFARQYFRYGIHKAFVIRQHPESTKLRHLAPPLFAAGLVVGAALLPLGALWRWLYGAALTAYGLLVITFSVVQAARHGWRYLPILPIAFIILHTAWGFGFWVGVWRWWVYRSN